MLDFELTQNQLFGCECAILKSQKKLSEYDKDGNATGNILGTTFTVLAYGNDMEEIPVKCEGVEFLDVSDDDIRKACASLTFIFVSFEGFAGKTYIDKVTKKKKATAKATAVRIVNRDEIETINVFD